jgi:hypothetical protein
MHRQRLPVSLKNQSAHDAELVRGILPLYAAVFA